MHSKELEISSFNFSDFKKISIDIEVDGSIKKKECMLYWPHIEGKNEYVGTEHIFTEKNNGTT